MRRLSHAAPLWNTCTREPTLAHMPEALLVFPVSAICSRQRQGHFYKRIHADILQFKLNILFRTFGVFFKSRPHQRC